MAKGRALARFGLRRILTAAGGGTAVRNTLAGGIPFGEVSLAAAVLAINSGQKLIIIGAGAQTVSDQMWVVKKDSPLKGIKDLVGKQIAYTAPGSVSNMVMAPASTGRASSSRNAVTRIDQTNSGMRCSVMPGARMLKIVVMKLIAPSNELAPARCSENSVQSMPRPVS